MALNVRRVTEPQDLRALAHPLRLRLLGALRLDGPATASDLARRFGVSSGLTSYHLRALAERGFVEDDPERSGEGGRERWWRASHDATEWHVPPPEDDPVEHAGRVEASRALNVEAARMYGRWLEKVAVREPDLDERWRGASAGGDRWMKLTPDQLRRLSADLQALVERYAAEESEDGERVGILYAAFPDDGTIL
ncbi:MAG TPA: helix-turn-helix domain-containing protein [Solirubrobacteraceae bacterium]|jgi:DNA-binding transcriptional ArsR family regulator